MDIINYLANDNYIIVNKELAKTIGLNESIIIGELASELKYYRNNNKLEDGWFFSTIENIQENTTLNEYMQRKAINNLKNIGILDIKVKGIPAKRYIKINEEQVIKLLNSKFFNNLSSSSLKFKELDVKNLRGNNNIYNNNKNNNTTTTTINIIEQNFGRSLTPIEYDKLAWWFNYFDLDVINYAIEQAVLNNKRTINYVIGILKNWKQKGYKSLIDVKEENQKKNLTYDDLREMIKKGEI